MLLLVIPAQAGSSAFAIAIAFAIAFAFAFAFAPARHPSARWDPFCCCSCLEVDKRKSKSFRLRRVTFFACPKKVTKERAVFATAHPELHCYGDFSTRHPWRGRKTARIHARRLRVCRHDHCSPEARSIKAQSVGP
ncbi:MAG TPA: hypothetical protein VGQ93_15200 [Lysobacter sp.]|nr:hypothetical protein [Lysobacter sp.]